MPEMPRFSVVVCFIDNGVKVRECIDAILAGTTPEVEVIAVNNRPMNGDAAGLAQAFANEPRVIIIEEPRCGLSAARNAGAQLAKGEILVFTDDDVVPSEQWLAAVDDTFASCPEASCVTGPIEALRLSTDAQLLMDRYAGFVKSERRTVYRMSEHKNDPLFPYAAGRFGSGANLAIRAITFRIVGGFDQSLGIGTASRSGEDLEFFVRLMLDDRVIVYDPEVRVLHDHPESMNALKREVFGYGSGLTAATTRTLLKGPQRLRLIASLFAGLRFALDPKSSKNLRKGDGFPVGLTLRELLGMFYGPLGYLRSRVSTKVG